MRSDDDFVRDMALKNMAVTDFSRLALDKATNAQIQVYARMMLQDHGPAGDRLRHIVAGQPIDWPAQLDDEHGRTADELSRAHGEDFDRVHLKAMIDGHQNLTAKLESRLDVRSVAEWKTAAAARTETGAMPHPGSEMRDVPLRPQQSGNDLTMKINQWAADTYPVAQKHLDAARALENEAKTPSTQ